MRRLTTHTAMRRDVCSRGYASLTGYSASVSNLAQVTTANDNVFDSSTSAQVTALTDDDASGHLGRVVIDEA